MVETKKEYEKIGMTTKTNSDFTKQSTEHSNVANEFEKRLHTSLLLGSGAALVFLLNWGAQSVITENFEAIRIISAWFFVVSLFSTFASGYCYTVHSWRKSDELSEKANLESCKNTNLDTRNNIQKALLVDKSFSSWPEEEQFEKTYDDKYLLSTLQIDTKASIEEQLIRERETLPNSIAECEKIAKRWSRFAKVFIGLGVVGFGFGVLTPLAAMTRSVFC